MALPLFFYSLQDHQNPRSLYPYPFPCNNPTENFLPAYKKACRENEVTPAKSLLAKIEEIMEDGDDLNEIYMNNIILFLFNH